MKSICPVCGNKKSRFISQASGLFDSLGLNTPQNRIMHLWDPKVKKYSACGPFTRHQTLICL